MGFFHIIFFSLRIIKYDLVNIETPNEILDFKISKCTRLQQISICLFIINFRIIKHFHVKCKHRSIDKQSTENNYKPQNSI